jgi:hypothetical protein
MAEVRSPAPVCPVRGTTYGDEFAMAAVARKRGYFAGSRSARETTVAQRHAANDGGVRRSTVKPQIG